MQHVPSLCIDYNLENYRMKTSGHQMASVKTKQTRGKKDPPSHTKKSGKRNQKWKKITKQLKNET